MRNTTRERIMYEGSILSACYHMVSALRVGIPGPGLSCGTVSQNGIAEGIAPFVSKRSGSQAITTYEEARTRRSLLERESQR